MHAYYYIFCRIYVFPQVKIEKSHTSTIVDSPHHNYYFDVRKRLFNRQVQDRFEKKKENKNKIMTMSIKCLFFFSALSTRAGKKSCKSYQKINET